MSLLMNDGSMQFALKKPSIGVYTSATRCSVEYRHCANIGLGSIQAVIETFNLKPQVWSKFQPGFSGSALPSFINHLPPFSISSLKPPPCPLSGRLLTSAGNDAQHGCCCWFSSHNVTPKTAAKANGRRLKHPLHQRIAYLPLTVNGGFGLVHHGNGAGHI